MPLSRPLLPDRPTLDEVFMQVAEVMAQRSTCLKRHVGAVLVSPDNHIVSSGYNGAPKNCRHCTQDGCILGPTGSCLRAVHSELNALLRAGYRARKATMYCTLCPCFACATAMINAGVVRVVYREYRDRTHHEEPNIVQFLIDAGIQVCQL